MASIASNWLRARNQANHDWLKNQYMLSIGSIMVVLDGQCTSTLTREMARQRIAAWNEQADYLRDLLKRTSQDLSPRQWFDQAPLCRLAKSIRSWLVPTVHSAWLTSGRIETLTVHALEQCDAVDACCQRAISALSGPGRLIKCEDELNAIRELRDACQSLSQAISGLPHRVPYSCLPIQRAAI